MENGISSVYKTSPFLNIILPDSFDSKNTLYRLAHTYNYLRWIIRVANECSSEKNIPEKVKILNFSKCGWTLTWQGQSGNENAGTSILTGIHKAVSEGTTVTYNKDGTGAAGYDVAIVVIGETPYAESAGDRVNLDLDALDCATLENVKSAGVPMVVIMISGRPMIVTDQIGDWDAFVEAWLPGTEGGGVADVLFGDYDFTGKLPLNWPWYYEQIPIKAEDSEQALFPYGFGLSSKEPRPSLPAKPPKNR